MDHEEVKEKLVTNLQRAIELQRAIPELSQLPICLTRDEGGYLMAHTGGVEVDELRLRHHLSDIDFRWTEEDLDVDLRLEILSASEGEDPRLETSPVYISLGRVRC